VIPHSPRPVDTPTARVAAAPPLATTDGTQAVYPVVSVDASHVRFRDGKVANRPIHVALAVTSEGLQDVLQALAR
jgi:putative transposase